MSKKKGLWDNIHAKRKRIKRQKKEGKKVERMRKAGSKGAPTAEALEKSKGKKTSKVKFE
jgi:hypothetical protein